MVLSDFLATNFGDGTAAAARDCQLLFPASSVPQQGVSGFFSLYVYT